MTALYTLLALVAFSANSILCRLALGTGAIDAASFTLVRLVSGAVLLAAVTRFSGNALSRARPGWRSAVALFGYALAFSLAYRSLTAGTGALVLFGAVQATMLIAALVGGERPRWQEWTGLLVAVAGLVYLVLPGLAAPPIGGFTLMALSGVSWGGYSLWGRRAEDPIGDTAANFLRAVPMAVVASASVVGGISLSGPGVAMAAVSGAVTSGLGYVAWYAALGGLTRTRAATVQLPVPLLTAAGGVLFLAEDISLRLVVSGVLILGGVLLASLGRAPY